MEKRGTTTGASQSSGICQRLLNFILNTLFACSFKRETTGPSVSYQSSEIPIEGSSRNGLNPEVQVEYRHVDDIGWFNDPTRYNLWRGPRKTAPCVEVSSGEKDKSNLAAEAAIPVTTKPPPPRRPMLLSVTSNINEKAEAFIRGRREKMSRSYSSDLKKS